MAERPSRRDVLKTLTAGGVAWSALGTVPLEAASYVHGVIASEKAATAKHDYQPKFFSAHQYQTLQMLCEMILPADADSGGAIEAGAPEFIDLLTSENTDYQLRLGGGMMWLDSACADRFGSDFVTCREEQRRAMLDTIAYRKHAEQDASLTQAVAFFTLLRNLTADGFFTSKIGIKYLGYIGNTYVAEFPGCPPVEGV